MLLPIKAGLTSYFAECRRPHRVEYILTFSAFPLMAQWNSQRFHSRAAWNYLNERDYEYLHMNNHRPVLRPVLRPVMRAAAKYAAKYESGALANLCQPVPADLPDTSASASADLSAFRSNSVYFTGRERGQEAVRPIFTCCILGARAPSPAYFPIFTGYINVWLVYLKK